MFGFTTTQKKKSHREPPNNPPSAKAKARMREREFVQFVKSFAIDFQKPAMRAWAAKRILREAKKYRTA